MSFYKTTQSILSEQGFFADSRTIRNIYSRGHRKPYEAAEVAILNRECIPLKNIHHQIKRLESLLSELKAL